MANLKANLKTRFENMTDAERSILSDSTLMILSGYFWLVASLSEATITTSALMQLIMSACAFISVFKLVQKVNNLEQIKMFVLHIANGVAIFIIALSTTLLALNIISNGLFM